MRINSALLPFASDGGPEWCDAPLCAYCSGVTPHAVRWQNARGMHHYFCDNECLVQWIQRGRETICHDIAMEHRAMLAAMQREGEGGSHDEWPNNESTSTETAA
jgi:hypothetical protein